jgi:hypothetical protein
VALLLPVRLLSRQAGARADTLRPSRRSCRCRQLGRRPSRHRACRYCPSCRRRAACRRSSCQGIVARAACRPSCRRRAARRPRPKAGAAASSARFLRTAVMLCTGVSFGYEIFELLSNREVIGACRLGRPRAGQGLKGPRSRARNPRRPNSLSCARPGLNPWQQHRAGAFQTLRFSAPRSTMHVFGLIRQAWLPQQSLSSSHLHPRQKDWLKFCRRGTGSSLDLVSPSWHTLALNRTGRLSRRYSGFRGHRGVALRSLRITPAAVLQMATQPSWCAGESPYRRV